MVVKGAVGLKVVVGFGVELNVTVEEVVIA